MGYNFVRNASTMKSSERKTGTVVRGIRCPIIRQGDSLADTVLESLLGAARDEGFEIRDRDVVAITESVVARAEGNYATVSDIAKDVRTRTGGGTVGVIFPILSRNRFAICLKGIARGCSKVVMMLSYPSDEVGNSIMDLDRMDEAGINPYTDVLTLERYREVFGVYQHEFTGIDYVEYYSGLVRGEGAELEFVFANRPEAILRYTDTVINCDIHTRRRTRRILEKAGARVVVGMDQILSAPVDGSGYNENFGLLGSNKASEDSVKLFPRSGDALVHEIQSRILAATGRHVEVMVYGDGAFKDPKGKIWELADPIVSPFFTEGLLGTPNELKIKFLADSQFADLKGEELQSAISESIRRKDASLKGKMVSEGTTPRQLTDLIGSLCDLTSGSGDKGTPVVLVQGYFDNYSTE